MSTNSLPELKRSPIKLPFVLQRMQMLQNSVQQELEHRQLLIDRIQEIQREVCLHFVDHFSIFLFLILTE